MIYELRDAPAEIPRDPEEILIPSRRWQMWRTAVQDYLLLQQVKRHYPEMESKLKKIAASVLAKPESCTGYENARNMLLEIIAIGSK